jgi:membrane protein implicated in regulation of membrane protease activity
MRCHVSRLKTTVSVLAVIALLALAWFWLGPDSAIQLAIATAVVLIAMVIWTIWRERKREGNVEGSAAEERSSDPHA